VGGPPSLEPVALFIGLEPQSEAEEFRDELEFEEAGHTRGENSNKINGNWSKPRRMPSTRLDVIGLM
jgi:hypothetical protein